LEARKHAHKFCLLVEVMMQESKMACFLGGAAALAALKARFSTDKPEQECVEEAVSLVDESIDNWRSGQCLSFVL